MSKKSVYDKWQDRIRLAQEYKKKLVDPAMIKRFHDYMKNDYYKDTAQTDRISVNQVFTNVKILVATLALQEPEFKAIADDSDQFRAREPIIESALNNAFHRMKYNSSLKKVVKDAHINWGGVMNLGYSFKLAREILDKDITEVDPKTRDEKEFAEAQIYHEYIKSDSVFSRRVSPGMFFIEPDSTENLVTAGYCFETFIFKQSYLEEKYGVDMSSIPAKVAEWLSDIMKSLGLGNDKEVRKGALHQIYSLEEGKRIVLIEGADKAFEYDWNYDFYPYETLIFNENPDENYGTPDVKQYEPQQLELNKLRTTQMNTINRNNGRYQMLKNGVDAEEVRKFETNTQASLIITNVDGAIKPIQQLSIDPNHGAYQNAIVGDIQTQAGTDAIMSENTGVRKSASEAAIRDYYAKLRIAERKDAVDTFTVNCAVKILQFMQEEYSIPRMVDIAGANAKFLFDNLPAKDSTNKGLAEQLQGIPTPPGGIPIYKGKFPADKTNLTGKYQIFLRTSTYAQNKQLEAQRLQAFLQFLAVNPMINPKELTEIVVDLALDEFDTSKLIVPDAYQMSVDPLQRVLFQQIMMSMGKMDASGQPVRSAPGSAGPAMTGAKMGSEAIQIQGPQGAK